MADRHGLAIVEDAAHCLEGRRDGARPASHAATACFSFYATKNLTCGEGGALATNDTALYEKLKLLRLHGMTKNAYDRYREGYRHWDMSLLGWKYNMSNIEAAILLPQLRAAGAQARRTAGAGRRATWSGSKDIPGIRVPAQAAGRDSVHAHHVFPVWIESNDRDAVVTALQQAGVEVVVNYRPVHLTRYLSRDLSAMRKAISRSPSGSATSAYPCRTIPACCCRTSTWSPPDWHGFWRRGWSVRATWRKVAASGTGWPGMFRGTRTARLCGRNRALSPRWAALGPKGAS